MRIVAHAASFLVPRPIRPWARCDEFVTIVPGGEFASFPYSIFSREESARPNAQRVSQSAVGCETSPLPENRTLKTSKLLRDSTVTKLSYRIA